MSPCVLQDELQGQADSAWKGDQVCLEEESSQGWVRGPPSGRGGLSWWRLSPVQLKGPEFLQSAAGIRGFRMAEDTIRSGRWQVGD